MTNTGSPYSVTRMGSGSSAAPDIAQNCGPSRKSRLPCITKQGTPLTLRACNPAIASRCAGSASSSPTQDSNRSPRMYRASAPAASVRRKLKNCRVISGRLASMCRSEMKSVATRSRGGGVNAFDFQDHDLFERSIFLERAHLAGGHVADLVHHLHALDNFSEHCVTPARLVRIERRIVVEIDIELRVGAVRFGRARHADGAALGGQAVARFVERLVGSGLQFVTGVVAAALNEETGDHSMENRVGLLSLVDIAQEVRNGERCAF